MTAPLVFVDLDDSIFVSARRLGERPSAAVGYVDADGEAAGHCTHSQWALFRWLKATARVIPVTARRPEAMARVALPFDAEVVCCAGGLMLTSDGAVDAAWREEMRRALTPHQGDLVALEGAWASAAGAQPVRHRIVGHGGLGMYLDLKHMARDAEALQGLIEAHRGALAPEGWHLHVHGHSAALAPPPLSKAAAVAHLIARHPSPLTVGVGDSAADHGFLSLCDVAMLPTDSDLFAGLSTHLISTRAV